MDLVRHIAALMEDPIHGGYMAQAGSSPAGADPLGSVDGPLNTLNAPQQVPDCTDSGLYVPQHDFQASDYKIANKFVEMVGGLDRAQRLLDAIEGHGGSGQANMGHPAPVNDQAYIASMVHPFNQSDGVGPAT